MMQVLSCKELVTRAKMLVRNQVRRWSEARTYLNSSGPSKLPPGAIEAHQATKWARKFVYG